MCISFCFKPYYKWITLNTINASFDEVGDLGFKPYYKWITLNTDTNQRGSDLSPLF